MKSFSDDNYSSSSSIDKIRKKSPLLSSLNNHVISQMLTVRVMGLGAWKISFYLLCRRDRIEDIWSDQASLILWWIQQSIEYKTSVIGF